MIIPFIYLIRIKDSQLAKAKHFGLVSLARRTSPLVFRGQLSSFLLLEKRVLSTFLHLLESQLICAAKYEYILEHVCQSVSHTGRLHFVTWSKLHLRPPEGGVVREVQHIAIVENGILRGSPIQQNLELIE